MAIGLKSWSGTGFACIAFVFLVVIALVGILVSQSLPNPQLLLGSPELCSDYSGLPTDWGKNPHAGMVRIHAGEFILGTTLGYEEERQETKAQVNGFWIDQTEVTVAQFADFVKATNYVTEAEREGGAVVFHNPSPEELNQRSYAWWRYLKGASWRHPMGNDSLATDNQPVTLVTLVDALAYAKWLGHDLPTEAEWEYAGKAGGQGAALEKEPRDENNKPLANFWQGSFPVVNNAEDGYAGLSPVGCFPANAFKLYDMIGNAWEQTKDVYTASHDLTVNQNNTSGVLAPNRPMVVKGGSHLCGRDFCVRYRPSAREAHEANLPTSHIGFRTVMRDNAILLSSNFNPW